MYCRIVLQRRPSLCARKAFAFHVFLHAHMFLQKEENMREKQLLYKKVKEAEKSPFFLHPHQHAFMPFLPFNGKVQPFYVQRPSQKFPGTPYPNAVPSPPSGPHTSPAPYPLGISSPAHQYTPQLYPTLLKYPFPSPTSAGVTQLGLLSPWNTSNTTQTPVSVALPQTTSDGSGDKTVEQVQQTNPIIPRQSSAYTSVLSPLYLHSSPASLVYSPYASSISSNTSTTSGCSSDNGDPPRARRYAASEYHVGPRPTLSEKLAEEDSQPETPNNSGRNTPEDSAEKEGVVLPEAIASLLPVTSFLTSESQSSLSQMSSIARGHVPSPYSIESLSRSQASSIHLTSQVSCALKSTILLLTCN